MKNKHDSVSKETATNIKKPNELELEKIIELIQKPEIERTQFELKSIKKYLVNNIEYFKKMNEESDKNERILKIIQILNYEKFKKDEYIINYGEIGDKFYIILSGSVNVYKPSPQNVSMTLYDYVKYLVNIRDVEKNNIKFERIQNYNSKIDRDKLIQIKYNPDKLPYSSKKISVVIEEQRYLNHLRAGDTFGEMALIKNETRNADVVVDDEECILGSVDKLDYKKIIKDIEEQKINTKLKEFKMDFPLFNDWPASRCFRLLSALTGENYNKEDYVYKQNTLATHLYIIRKGEFDVTCDINFSIYERFIEYIHSNPDILFKDSDNKEFWKEDNLEKIINSSLDKNESPFLSLPHITKFVLSHQSDSVTNLKKSGNLLNENNNYMEEKKLDEISKKEDMENNMRYMNNMIRRIKICRLEAPQIFGFVEPLELKRRFCNIRCDSNQGEIQKIPLIEFLQLMPKDKKNINNLMKYIRNKKKDLMERLKNGTLAKLSFNYQKPQITSLGINYPNRNLDKHSSKKSKLLIRSKSILLNHNLLSSNNNISSQIENETSDVNKNSLDSDLNNINNSIKGKSNILIGFKKSLFNDNSVRTEIQNLMKNFQNKKKKIEITSSLHIGRNNRYKLKDYNYQNSAMNILPTKFSLVPHTKLIGRNYIDYDSKKIMKELNKNSAILDNIVKKTEERRLPLILSKQRSNSLKAKNIQKFQRKTKKNVTSIFPNK